MTLFCRIPDEKKAKLNEYFFMQGYQEPLLKEDGFNKLVIEYLNAYTRLAYNIIDGLTKLDQKRPNIYFSFYETLKDINAQALCIPTLPNDYFILCTLKAPMQIRKLFARLFSSPYFLPEIGDASLEIVSTEEVNIDNIKSLRDKSYFPKCPVRENYAVFVSAFAFVFLVCHELAHIRNGHLLYIKNNYRISSLSELYADSNSDKESILKHTLEMDADSHAIVHSLNFLLNSLGNRHRGKHLDGIIDSPENAVRTMIIATYTLFKLFNNRKFDENNLWAGTHPHPIMRQHIAVGTLFTHMERMKQWDNNPYYQNPDALDRLKAHIIQNIEHNLLDKRKDVRASTLLNIDVVLSNAGKYFLPLHKCWANIHDRLNELKFCNEKLAVPEKFE